MRGTRLFTGLPALAILAVTLSMTTWAAAQWNEKVLHNFYNNGAEEGWTPAAGLVMDAAGNLYGTTSAGGIFITYGTVFELSPVPGGGWSETVLHSFNDDGTDGWTPLAGLIFDAAGNLYGTTGTGGTYHGGTVFELSPVPGGGWTETVLHSFGNGTDGSGPGGGSLIFDATGNLYGTTTAGGTFTCPRDGCGTVFELTPTVGGAWTETVLYNFQRGSDGHVPYAGLIFDASGNLYGTTQEGGTGNCLNGQTHGCGTVFELTPAVGGGWAETVLHNFGIGNDGTYPGANLIFDSAGNLYGTTVNGGDYVGGTAFELTPAPGGAWNESVLYSFNLQGPGGAGPVGPLVFDAAGSLYGTAIQNGIYYGGTTFKLTPGVGGTWTETVLHSFNENGSDGYYPVGGVIFDAAGNLYGMTQSGGTNGCGIEQCGTAYKMTPIHPCIRCSHAGLQ